MNIFFTKFKRNYNVKYRCKTVTRNVKWMKNNLQNSLITLEKKRYIF